jgi:TetR/AcrR family transcriptional repressor of bet genes
MDPAEPATATAVAPAPRAPRKRPRDARRLQLIEATIETLASRGYARTTLTEVAQVARLSHGLVNFHFKTKDLLLAETLAFLAEEYRQNWLAALEAAPSDPVSRLDAMLTADFNPAIYTPARLGAWCAFWGEAQCRPLYQAECSGNDAEYNAALERLVAALIAAGGYALDPVRVARVLRVTIEGIWLDLMTMQAPYPRAEALATVYTCAAAFFPRHFSVEGPIAGGLAVRPAAD